MKQRITSVQLAVLDSKQSRAKELYRQLDDLHRQTCELLGMDMSLRHVSVLESYARDAVHTYLTGDYTPVMLCRVLGIRPETNEPTEARGSAGSGSSNVDATACNGVRNIDAKSLLNPSQEGITA